MFRSLRLLAQLALTVLALALPWANAVKLIVLLVIWSLTFWPISRREFILFGAMCILFTAMNAGALAQGVFRFSQPDLLGMPVWEFFMWGFYVLHLLRVVRGPMPDERLRLSLVLVVLFAIPFAAVSSATVLFSATAIVLSISFFFFHDRYDFFYAGYMLFVGALVEYTGVWSGQWSYPDAPPGGVPIWFVPMWAGVGLFTRRVAIPLFLCREESGWR